MRMSARFCFVMVLAAAVAGCSGNNGANGANGNTAPVANAGPDQRVASVGSLVILDGGGSSDANGNALTYAWSFAQKPVGSGATLSSAAVSNPTFTVDKAGKYVLSLEVNDGGLGSAADSVAVWAGTIVPDTGQKRWYSANFGDDGDYTINPMSFTDNYNGTIADTVTGLLWQKCSMGQSGADCATGTAATYNWYEASGTYDAVSNPSSVNVCGSLNLAGTGWRLPTSFELMTIVDYGRYNPAIDAVYYPLTPEARAWTSTSYASDSSSAWTVNFYDGTASGSAKTGGYNVRCVR